MSFSRRANSSTRESSALAADGHAAQTHSITGLNLVKRKTTDFVGDPAFVPFPFMLVKPVSPLIASGNKTAK